MNIALRIIIAVTIGIGLAETINLIFNTGIIITPLLAGLISGLTSWLLGYIKDKKVDNG